MTPENHVSSMSERIGALNQKIEAFHGRQDKMESEIKSLLKELSLEMKILQKDLVADMKEIQQKFVDDMDEFKEEMKEVRDWVNKAKGWGAAAMLLATLVGGIIAKLLIK